MKPVGYCGSYGLDEIDDEQDFAENIGVQITTTADDFVSDMKDGKEDYEGKRLILGNQTL